MNPVTDSEFASLSEFAKATWGLVIDENKSVIVENRIAALGRTTDVEAVKSLISDTRGRGNRELQQKLFDALSTHHTHFFRESEQLDVVVEHVISPAKRAGKHDLRLWSAGCSRGCEPYTLSILRHEAFQSSVNSDHRILATDLSAAALCDAQQGRYALTELDGVSPLRRRAHFESSMASPSGPFTIKPELKKPVSFGMLNLILPWPMKGPFDVILCRNVMIYFDVETRRKLAQRFLQLLRPGGLLLVGTSESLVAFDLDIEVVAASAYRKPGDTS